MNFIREQFTAMSQQPLLGQGGGAELFLCRTTSQVETYEFCLFK